MTRGARAAHFDLARALGVEQVERRARTLMTTSRPSSSSPRAVRLAHAARANRATELVDAPAPINDEPGHSRKSSCSNLERQRSRWSRSAVCSCPSSELRGLAARRGSPGARIEQGCCTSRTGVDVQRHLADPLDLVSPIGSIIVSPSGSRSSHSLAKHQSRYTSLRRRRALQQLPRRPGRTRSPQRPAASTGIAGEGGGREAPPSCATRRARVPPREPSSPAHASATNACRPLDSRCCNAP